MARNVKATNSNSGTNDNTPADHFMNVYLGGVQIGYMVLDDNPAIVEKAQKDPEFLNRLMKSEKSSAVYRQRGVSSKPQLDLDDI